MKGSSPSKRAPGNHGKRPWVRPALMMLFAALMVAVVAHNQWRHRARHSNANAVGLLGGLQPTQAPGVKRAAALTDGIHARDGGAWDSSLTAVFTGDAFVEYDLGETKAIAAAHLHGDNNDEYVISVSDDGETYKTIWKARPQSARGLQPRSVRKLKAEGRFVRVSVGRGDASRGLSEVQLFSEAPPSLPWEVRFKTGVPTGEALRGHLLFFALALAFFLFATSRKSSRMWTVVCLLAPLMAALQIGFTLSETWPVGAREVAYVRAVAAAIAALAVVREVTAPAVFPARRASVLGALGIAAITAIMSFYNLGRPQFFDEGEQRPTLIHGYDMRVYYPVAKYFSELRYDGLYVASVAAYIDDDPKVTLQSLGKTELRDLRTHRMKKVADVGEQVRDVKKRFSPERWQEFVEDMRYFRHSMGSHNYLRSMNDHGGNATPVWLAVAYLLFAGTTASDATMHLGAALDPLILLLAFFFVGRTYGWRTMMVSMVVFGATDFYMAHTNWAGATLRHDWLAYLMMGVCALKSERWALGGVLLAASASIRAFPALALFGVALPTFWWLFDHVRTHRSLPSLRKLRDAQGPFVRVVIGAAAGSFVLWLLSSLVLSFDAWPAWLAKVGTLEGGAHVNHVSLRSLVAGSDSMQSAVLKLRLPAFVSLIAACAALVALASRPGRLDHAAVLGCLLIPVIFNPANYYIHFIMILPLLSRESARTSAKAASTKKAGADEPNAWHNTAIWLPMLGLCIAQYWTTLEKSFELHFQQATVLLFASLAALIAIHLHGNRASLRSLLRGQKKSSAPRPSSS